MKVYRTVLEIPETDKSIIIDQITGWLIEWKNEFHRQPNKATITVGLKLFDSLESHPKVSNLSTYSQYLVLSLYDINIRIISSWEADLHAIELSLE